MSLDSRLRVELRELAPPDVSAREVDRLCDGVLRRGRRRQAARRGAGALGALVVGVVAVAAVGRLGGEPSAQDVRVGDRPVPTTVTFTVPTTTPPALPSGEQAARSQASAGRQDPAPAPDEQPQTQPAPPAGEQEPFGATDPRASDGCTAARWGTVGDQYEQGPPECTYTARFEGGYEARGQWRIIVTRRDQTIVFDDATSPACGAIGVIQPGDHVRLEVKPPGPVSFDSYVRAGADVQC